MDNVVRLFDRRTTETIRSEHDAGIRRALKSLSASQEKLDCVVNRLSRQFDAIDSVIETVDDAGTRIRFKQSVRLNQETLSKALLKLTQQIETLAYSPKQ
jgi:hypothetical protein